jgi:hypothetical protein
MLRMDCACMPCRVQGEPVPLLLINVSGLTGVGPWLRVEGLGFGIQGLRRAPTVLVNVATLLKVLWSAIPAPDDTPKRRIPQGQIAGGRHRYDLPSRRMRHKYQESNIESSCL